MNGHFLKIALASLVCLTCLGCFCVEPDILPADKAERLKAIPEGTWATYSDKDERQDDLEVAWSDAYGCYTSLGEGQPESERVLLRFYHLATPPYYAMLMIPMTSTEEDADLDCPAALFLIRVQEGQMEFVLPLNMDEAESEALAKTHGVNMVDEKLVGTPEGVLAYLDGLANADGLELLQRYAYPAPPKEPKPEAAEDNGPQPQNTDEEKPKTKR